jgi:transcriptional regulator with XRE-family HTH domain
MRVEIFTSIAHHIKQLMQRCNITDAELARQIKMPQATVSRILSGATQDPRISTMSAIARVLGTSIDYLVNTDSVVPVLAWHEIVSVWGTHLEGGDID